MINCWICYKQDFDYILLPYDDEYLESDISIFRNTIIIKNVSPFKFLYFTCCNDCIDKLIKYKYSGNFFKKLKNREITGKKN